MGATTCFFVNSMASEAHELARGLRRRDPDLLDRLVGQYHYRLFRYLTYLTGRRETAEDLFQETWMRVIERGHQYDPKWQFEAWLFSIARHLVIDLARKKSPLTAAVDLDEASDAPLAKQATETAPLRPASPIEVLMSREESARLAAVLGGTNSLHTNSLDEALALPTEKAVLIALRTQQVIAHESGVVNTVDPLGGSYFIESLTDETERAAMDYLNRIDALGGVLACILNGFFQREIAESAYRYQQEIDQHKRTIVGVNDYIMEEDIRVPTLYIDRVGERAHLERLNRVRRERDNAAVERSLENLRRVAQGTENTMPAIIEAVKTYATLGEIMDVFRSVFGDYMEPAVY